MDPLPEREFDLLLVGATGFVGRLTAADLAQHAPPGVRVGLAGRSPERLAEVREGLPEPARAWPVLRVDLGDDAAVRDLAERTRVVATTAGPYLQLGLPLVTACADAGTSYADLTGEAVFVRRSIDAAHERAERSGARIVHSCGFDSVPSDLGVGLAAERAAEDGEGPLVDAVLHVRSARGGVSGGTIDSLRQMIIEAQRDEEARAITGDPWALVDDSSGRSYWSDPVHRGPLGIAHESDAGWQVPFVMGGFNRQIVFRSNALGGWPYGREFAYREVVDAGHGLPGLLGATGIAVGGGALLAGLWFGPSRMLLDRLLPDPGQGPSEKTRQAGRFVIDVDARTTTGARYRTTIAVDLDPGYGATAVMLAESALSLALDELPSQAGVLTPMSALGGALAARLRTRGFTVLIERVLIERVSSERVTTEREE
jgi:short subunit dehydrogenase-like uncharacterized protein